MGSLSQDSSHLSISDISTVKQGSSDTFSMLKQVSSSRDLFSDDDHKDLDAFLEETFYSDRQLDEEPPLAAMLFNIISSDERLVRRNPKRVKELLSKEPSIEVMLKEAWKKGSFKEVRRLEILWPEVHQRSKVQLSQEEIMASAEQEKTIEQSWFIPYRGDASANLLEHLSTIPPMDTRTTYARHISIVQSSGMGKSRAVDELSKTQLVVPINLRRGATGYPAPDDKVRDWFLGSGTKLESFTRSGAFLCALFTVLLTYLSDLDKRVARVPLPPGEARPDSTAGKFRLLMTAGQSFSKQGRSRCKFYDEVLRMADELLPPEHLNSEAISPSSSEEKMLSSHNETASSSSKAPVAPSSTEWMPPDPTLILRPIQDHQYDLKDRLEALIDYLSCNRIPAISSNEFHLILSFDEADRLTKVKDGSWSRFTELRRALRTIQLYSCVSIFLSATGKMHQFTPTPASELSNRLLAGELCFIHPFCELGFDQLAEKAVVGQTTLEYVSSTAFKAKLGRPLFASRYIKGDASVKDTIVWFAIEKLLCKKYNKSLELTVMEKTACLSVRLPFEFHRMNLHHQNMQDTLVEKHMRVCISVDPEFETTITIAPSEPLLAEAAYQVMKNKEFNLPRSLLQHLEDSGLSQRDRGEFVAMAICLKARDAAAQKLHTSVIPVNDFIRELLAPETHANVLSSKPAETPLDEGETFERTHCHSKVNFTHFVRYLDGEMINRKFLMHLVVRGAAGYCVNGQRGIDIIIPMPSGDDGILRYETLSALLIQAKNDGTYTLTIQQSLFDGMDPYKTKFVEHELCNAPIIRMVFALASPSPGVRVRKPPTKKQPPSDDEDIAGRPSTTDQDLDAQPSDGQTQPPQGDDRDPKKKSFPKTFTAFDIWCAGVSNKTFRPIGEDEDIYLMLLNRPHLFQRVYDAKPSTSIANTTRSMNPATDIHPAHYDRFIQF